MLPDNYDNIELLLENAKWRLLTSKALYVKNFIYENDPGVYVIARSEIDLSYKKIDPKDIFYIGMSNSRFGVRGRLKQFLNAVTGKRGHSGGNRFLSDFLPKEVHVDSNSERKFFYAAFCLSCNVEKEYREPNDLLTMGEVARLEYLLLAHVKEKMGREPELNLR